MERLPVCECESIHTEVVEAVRPQLLDNAEAIDLGSLFKLFGDGTRVRILQALRVHELCVCDLEPREVPPRGTERILFACGRTRSGNSGHRSGSFARITRIFFWNIVERLSNHCF